LLIKLKFYEIFRKIFGFQFSFPYFYYEKFRIMLRPTESELEIMQVLWEHGPLTVRQVNDLLNRQRRVGYTTTLKIMQIMTDKGMLTRDTGQRSHIYSPALQPEEVQAAILDHVLRTVYRGSTSSLVLQALGNHTASRTEMEKIKALIEKLEEKDNGTH
jgi:BlaI family penicillinase repressor